MLRIPTQRRRPRRPDGPTAPSPRRRCRPALEPLEGRVVLSISAASFAPSNGATGVNIDTPLAITFNQAPIVGTGNIVVHNADGSVFDMITLAPGSTPTSLPGFVAGAKSQRVIGGVGTPYNYYQTFINTAADTATLYLHKALAYGQVYYVTMDSGAFTDAAGDQSAGISDPSAWRFSTKASAPPAGTTQLTVAADGTGDFSTVQGAIDFVPRGNAQRVFILVRKGTYTEINNVVNKPFVTVYGEDRNQTIIQYPNNNTLQSPNGNNRIQFFDFSNDFALANLTIHNITPQNGSQAEAFGSGASRHVTVDGVNLFSTQDTFYAPSGTTYVSNSLIAGNVDFMWGGGAVYFQNDELRAIGGTTQQYYAWPRNAPNPAPAFNSPGFVYVNCNFTRADASVTNSYLARNDPRDITNGFPYSQMVLVNCTLGPNIVPVGWYPYNPGISGQPLITSAPTVRYWEYHSTAPNGNPIDVSQRAFFSSQISAELARRWSSIPFVLAGWVPDLTSVLPPGLRLAAASRSR